MTNQPFLDHSVIILVRGLPGSGKSYLTKPLAEAVQALTGEAVVTLDPDATDYQSAAYQEHVRQQTTEGVDPALHAYRFLRAQAYQGIAKHQVVIWNQPFTNLDIFNKMVARFKDHAASLGIRVSILVVEVEVEPDLAQRRVADRKAQGGHGPSDATFDRFVRDYTSFAPHGYNTVTVRGQDAASLSIATITAALKPLLAN